MSIETTYAAKANQIIKDSIKSAVYIDEKAWNALEGEPFNEAIEEHIISRDLHHSFKSSGIKLNIHKFKTGDQDLSSQKLLKEYLFGKSDLILLDWDLDEEENIENHSSLNLLREIIAQPNIHFCSIYSSAGDFEDIIKKICSFFSGVTKDQYDLLKTLVEPYDEIQELLSNLDIIKPDPRLIGQLTKIDNTLLTKAKEITSKTSSLELVTDFAIAITDTLPKSNHSVYYQKEIISNSNSEYTLLINNTILTILKKKDNQPKHFIEKFSNHVTSDRTKSYFKLLGLDMQNEFSEKGAFINPDILNIHLDSFLHHRRQINSSTDKQPFEDFMKDVLLKNAELNLSSTKLSFLENDFLDAIDERKDVDDHQLAQINCFYNGAYVEGDRNINFGDIFRDKDNNFFLCITALCDCALWEGQSNIKFKYHFAKGKPITLKLGIDKEDGGYISYIDRKTCISWTDGDYIKPIQLYVPKPLIVNKKITAFDWFDNCPVSLGLEYAFTLKQNYCQRIANHTFTHPIRVGIDFAKRGNDGNGGVCEIKV